MRKGPGTGARLQGGHGPLLLHGFTGSSKSWPASLVEGLAASGHRPVCLDLPGHGRHAGVACSRRPTLDAALSDVGAALEAMGAGLADLAASGASGEPGTEAGRANARTKAAPAGRRAARPVDLVGYSMGGRIALHCALTHPGLVRRLVLESASPGLATEAEREQRRASDEELAALLERGGMEPFVSLWEALPLFASQARLDAETRARQRGLRLSNDPPSLAAALRGLGTGALPSLWDRLGEVPAPSLLIVGELDEKFVQVAERMATGMSDARVVVVPDAGHAVHLERPDAWLEAVTRFL